MVENTQDDPLQSLYRRPGFMIRRAHQIAQSLFMEETGRFAITKTQYGILFILRHRPGLSQITVAKLLGLDRSTTNLVAKKLEEAGLVTLDESADDLRQRVLSLTPEGRAMLKRLTEPVRRAEENVLAAFDLDEQQEFLRLLEKFMRHFNAETRVPILPNDHAAASATKPSSKRRRRA